MAPPERQRFRTSQDWSDYVGRWISNPDPNKGAELHTLRQACYKEIEIIRGRPLIVYATKFLQAAPGAPCSIDLQDVDGFTDLVNSVSSRDGVDVLIHSPGGSPDATERIVHILRNKFREVHFLVPHSAYSAATMLALSGNSVTLHPSATLGPIDPQVNGTPARSIIRGFDNVREAIRVEGPEALPAYIPLIEKYTLQLLELCGDAEKLSKELVTEWISQYMLGGQEEYPNQIKEAVDFFSDYDTHKTHSRPLTIEKLQQFKLKITQAEDGLGVLLWESYLMIGGFFNLTPFVKLYESTAGVSWGKSFQVAPIPIPGPPNNIIGLSSDVLAF